MTMLEEKEKELEKEYKIFLTTQAGKEWMEHKKREVMPGEIMEVSRWS